MVATGAVGPVAGVPAAAGAAGFGMAQVGFGSTYLSTAAPMMSDATSATISLAVPETMAARPGSRFLRTQNTAVREVCKFHGYAPNTPRWLEAKPPRELADAPTSLNRVDINIKVLRSSEM